MIFCGRNNIFLGLPKNFSVVTKVLRDVAREFEAFQKSLRPAVGINRLLLMMIMKWVAMSNHLAKLKSRKDRPCSELIWPIWTEFFFSRRNYITKVISLATFPFQIGHSPPKGAPLLLNSPLKNVSNWYLKEKKKLCCFVLLQMLSKDNSLCLPLPHNPIYSSTSSFMLFPYLIPPPMA